MSKVGMGRNVIKLELLVCAYLEYKDAERKDDVVKNGIVSGTETAEFGGTVDIKDRDFWETIVKEGYKQKVREALVEEYIYDDEILNDIDGFEIFKNHTHRDEILNKMETIGNEPIRILTKHKEPKTQEDRIKIMDGFRHMSALNVSEGTVYENDVVKITDYKGYDDFEGDYEDVVGTYFTQKGLNYDTLEALQDALHNKVMNKTKREELVSKKYLNFKEEYEAMLGASLLVDLNVKVVGFEEEKEIITIEDIVKPIENLNTDLSKMLSTGIVDVSSIDFDEKGDMILEDKGKYVVKLKTFIPSDGDTLFRVRYQNDKRKNNFGKIEDVSSYSIKDDGLYEDTDDYLRFLNKI